MKQFTYCSFAEPKKFLGALILPGCLDAVQSARMAWKMNLNPGGELMCMNFEPANKYEESVVERYVGRLLSKADVEEFDATMEGIN